MKGFRVYDNENEEFVDNKRFVLRGDGKLFEMYVSGSGRIASRGCGDRFEAVPLAKTLEDNG